MVTVTPENIAEALEITFLSVPDPMFNYFRFGGRHIDLRT